MRPARLGEIADEGADDAALVDAMVLEEAPIFGGDERLLHEFGNVAERVPDAPVAGLEHVGEMLPVAVEHRGGAGQLFALQLRLIGQVGRRIIEEVDDLTEVDHRIGDGFVLAELMVGGVQVGEVEAVEGLDVGAYRLRVVERGGDEFIEVDQFDVERLSHMGAAVAQDLHHLVLILNRIEMRLDRLRRRRDLTECERRRKNLDQDDVHGEGGAAGSRDAMIQQRL